METEAPSFAVADADADAANVDVKSTLKNWLLVDPSLDLLAT